MNEFETIVKKEKETPYCLENKEAFTFCTLVLINQQEKLRRTKRNLAVCGLLAVVPMLLVYLFAGPFINSYTDLLIEVFTPLVYDPLIVCVFIFLISGFVVLNKRDYG